MPQPDEVREFLINLPVEQFGEIMADVETTRQERVSAQLEAEPKPLSTDRDDVARWLAGRHLAIDPSLVEVLYLREDLPLDDIHFVEVNRLLNLPAREGEPLEPVDFGFDVEGLHYSLFVVDVTPTQVELITQARLRLPQGWSMRGRRSFVRGSA